MEPLQSALLPSTGAHEHNDSANRKQALAEQPRLGDVCEAIQHALQTFGYPHLRTIHVVNDARQVTLVGCVPTYYTKQLATMVAHGAAPAWEILNHIDVVPPPDGTHHHPPLQLTEG